MKYLYVLKVCMDTSERPCEIMLGILLEKGIVPWERADVIPSIRMNTKGAEVYTNFPDECGVQDTKSKWMKLPNERQHGVM